MNVIQRKGAIFETAVVRRTGTRAPFFRINSFSKGVQAPKNNASSWAKS
jgi:hypothetical protein